MASVDLKTVGTLSNLPITLTGAYEVTFAIEANGAKGDLIVSVPIDGELDTNVVSKARELLKTALLALAEVASNPEPMIADPKIPF